METKRNPELSVLVPIYNASVFLPECLDSLISQTLDNIEIICINDGSTDDSLAIIQSYKKRDSRIVIIDKKNSGYGDSMNQGLKKATGEYIAIVEPDDWIESNAFEKLYSTAKNHQAQIVKSNYYLYFGADKSDHGVSDLFKKGTTGKLINPNTQRDIFFQPPSIWAAIYERQFLLKHQINFLPTPGASYQDTGFNFKALCMCERAVFLKDAFLHYRQDNSSSSVKSSGKIYFVKTEFDSIEEFAKKNHKYSELGPVIFACRAAAYVWNLNRLERRAALEFAATIKADYARAQKDGLIDRLSSLSGISHAKLFAVRHPYLYIRLNPLYGLYHKIKYSLKTQLFKLKN